MRSRNRSPIEASGRERRFFKPSRFVVLVGLLIAVPGSFSWGGDWRTHQTNLTTHQNKVRQIEGEIRDLVAQKRDTENPDQIKRIADLIAAKYEQLRESSEAYREEVLHVRFKHPEKGDETERKYPRLTLKTLKELEDETGLEGRLNRIKKRVEMVYGPAVPEDRPEPGAGAPAREPASRQTPSRAEGERILLSK